MARKIIISAALVGNGTTKEQNPATPYTPEEIARDSVACAKAGAAIIHIHVRDNEGHPTMSVDRFKETYKAVKKALADENLDAIINLSTGGSGENSTRIEQVATIKPEMCSYNPGSINWGKAFVYLNDYDLMESLGKLCQKTGTKPEIEIFDTAMVGNVKQAVKDGVLTSPCHFQFIMGIPGGMEGNIKNVSILLDLLPEGSTWSITGIGRSHMDMMLTALAAGANGIRVGLEDGIWLEKGVLATNETFVQQAVAVSKIAGCEPATAAEARQILGIKNPDPIDF